MSSSKSNISNQSSRSNILTLSQDSQSQQLKSHRANIYYKKFISKLGFLFRIDTQDLDALYNKIVQCMNQNEGFAKSDDIDINQLIQLAKQLKYNHSLLKNMVQVLDQRFLKNNNNNNNNYRNNQQFSQSINKLKKQTNQQHITTPIKNKQKSNDKIRHLFDIKNNQFSPIQNNDYSGYFNNTLQKARQQIKKKKQAQIQTQKQIQIQTQTQSQTQTQNNNQYQYPFQQTIKSDNKSQQTVTNPSISLSSVQATKSKYQQRINRIFEQMNKIKNQLKKIEKAQTQTQRQQQQYQASILIQNSANKNNNNKQKITQSLLQFNNDKKQIQEQSHQVFKQIQEDTYYLHDDRYQSLQQKNANVPKLSLKDLYTKMGVDPYGQQYQQEDRDRDAGMSVIKQSSRQSGSVTDLNIPKQNNINNQTNNYQYNQSYWKNNSTQQQQMIKTKDINNTTQTGNNYNLQNSDHFVQIQQNKTENYNNYNYITKNQKQNNEVYIQLDQNINQGESQKSCTVSSVSIIDKLNNQLKPTQSKIQQEQYNNVQPNQRNKFMKKYSVGTLGSLQTAAQNSKNNTEISFDGLYNYNQNKNNYHNNYQNHNHNNNHNHNQDNHQPNNFNRSQVYSEVIQKNERSRQKINNYLYKLDQRNNMLKKYVDQIEKSLSKQKQLRQQIGLQTNQVNKSIYSYQNQNQNQNRPLNNSVYTQNQIVIPKFIPNIQKNNNLQLQLQQLSHKNNGLNSINKSKNNQIFLNNQQAKQIMMKYKNQQIPKLASFSQKQFQSHQIIEKQQNLNKKPIVPILINLVQNGSKIISENGNKNIIQKNQSKKILNNNSYIITQSQNCKKQIIQKQSSISHIQQNKQRNIISQKNNHQSYKERNNRKIPYQYQYNNHNKIDFHNKNNEQLDLICKQSINSIQDRIGQNYNYHHNHNYDHININQNNQYQQNQFTIPQVTNHSLFQQTRNVQSKLELSQDRGYKFRIPGQQIQKIKDRVSQMFKKIKSIKEDVNHNIDTIQQKQSSSDIISIHQQQQQLLQVNKQPIKIQTNKPIQQKQQISYKKLQFKYPQTNSSNNKQTISYLPTTQSKQSSFINRIQSSKQLISSQNNTNIFSNQYPMKSSLIIDQGKKNNNNVFSFMCTPSNRSSRSRQANLNKNQNIVKPVILANSKDSNFSFRNANFNNNNINNVNNNNFIYNNKGLPQSIRSSNTYNVVNVSRTSSISSSKQKRIPLPIPSPIQHRNIIINRPPSQYPPSTRSSSNQSIKNTITKPLINYRTIRNVPNIPINTQVRYLPPKPQSPILNYNNTLNYSNKNHYFIPPPPSPIQTPTSNLQKPLNTSSQKKKKIQILQQKRTFQSPKIPVHPNYVKSPQNKNLSRNYSQTALTQSIVTNYTQISPPFKFNPPHMVSTPVNIRPKQITQTNSKDYSNSISNNLNNSQFQNASRSTSRSHKSKKGIKIISQKPKQKQY